MKPRAVDLFCKAGGATRGLQLAGFHVTGVDIEAQPRYCGDAFFQANALTFGLDGYDFIWASPPCQAFTTLRNLHSDITYPNLIPESRARLAASKIPYVIENVPGAPLRRSFMLCGSSFGLKVRRHRIFEASFLLNDWAPRCRHATQGTPIDVSGTGSRRIGRRMDGKGGDCNKPKDLMEAREAIGIDWMVRGELSQAIPPAYAEFIGRQFLDLRADASAEGDGLTSAARKQAGGL